MLYSKHIHQIIHHTGFHQYNTVTSRHYLLIITAMIQTWQAQLSNCIHNLADLYQHLGVERDVCIKQNQASQQFPIKVPLAFANRINPKNPQDPLLLQVVAQANEMNLETGFTNDPLAEQQSNALPGLLHKYHGRVLLMTGGQCAIHCRYCFRRHFNYDDNRPGRNGFSKICDYIQNDPSITEAIMSGGDPLVNSDKQLAHMISELEKIPHLKRLRIHTRLPVVLPDRITDELVTLLQDTRFDVVMVLHSNHAQEIDQSVEHAITKLKPHMTLLNQFVLLKNINDNADAICELQTTLFEAGVLPYYCHLPDKVQGTAHFDVHKQQALELIKACQARLPGYLLPRLAVEEPGEQSKTIVA